MKRSETRVSQPRWRTASSIALAIAAVAIIGFSTISPAKADDNDWQYRRGGQEREWRQHDGREGRQEWRGHHRPYAYSYYSYPSYSYSYSYPSYSYSYPSYPSYSYYSYPYGYSDYGYGYYR